MNCPICARYCADGSRRCGSCGADFRDPDVMAMAQAGAGAGVPLPVSVAAPAGALANDRMLGMTGAGIADGTSLRRLGLVGAGLLLIGAIVPIDLDFRGSKMPWTALDVGPKAALLVPLILAVAGLAVALLRRNLIAPMAVAAVLAAGGVVELTLGLTPFGHAAGTASALPVLTWLGMAAAAVGVTIRVLRPADPYARWIVLGGAVLFVAGMVFPHDDLRTLLPFEFRALVAPGAPIDDSLLFVYKDAATAHALVQFLALFHLLPMVLLPLAAALAFRRPTGLWDTSGNALRVLGFAIVLWLPLSFALAAFNVMGWPSTLYFRMEDHRAVSMDDLTRAFVLGRTRLALLSTGAMLWLCAGAAGLYVSLRDAASRTSSAR